MLFGGCVLNAFVLEMHVKKRPGAIDFVTFGQFLFASVMGFFEHFRCGRDSEGRGQYQFGGVLVPRAIPVRTYLKWTGIFVSFSVLNNKALDFGVSMPLHVAFRSCNLVVNLLVCTAIFGQRFSRQQVVSCLLVTFGIFAMTFADARLASNCCTSSGPRVATDGAVSYNGESIAALGATDVSWVSWCVGVAMLTVSILLTTLLGNMQTQAKKTYGNTWNESLFYSHAFALPWFVLLAPQMTAFGASLLADDGWTVALVPVSVVAQYMCIRGLFMLSDCTSHLTATLITTVRKSISLLLSVYYFGNPFTMAHTIGTLLVFTGACLYARAQTTSNNPNKRL